MMVITSATRGRKSASFWWLGWFVLLPVWACGQVVWDNGGGDNRWGTANNWSTNSVPNSGSNVQFNSTDDNATVSSIQLRANRSANSLTYNSVNDSFSLLNGFGNRTLTLTSGDITRTAGSSGTQSLAFTTLALGGDAAMNINGSGSLVISSAIVNSGGARSLTKSGTGTLVLSGTNTYSGGAILSAGTITLGNDSALGSGGFTVNSGTITASGTRTIANNVTVGGNFAIGGSSALTFNGSINLGGGTRTITVDNTAPTTFAGSVTEPWYSGLIKAGSGELVLSGNNSFTAPVTVSAGTLTLAHGNALGGSNWGNTVSSGATLSLTNSISVAEGQISVTGTGVGGDGAVRNVSGSNTLNSAMDLGGNTTFNSVAGTMTVSGQLGLGGSTLTIAGSGNSTLSGAITGSGSITKTQSGTLTLSGTSANSFGGALNVNDGTVALAKTDGTHAVAGSAVNIGDGSGAASSSVLRLDASNQIADYTGLVTVNADGVLQVNNFTEGINTLAGTGLVDLATSGYLAVGVNSGSSSFGGSITGTGTLEKAGSGSLTFTNDISFGGTLKLSGGTLALGDVSLTAGTLLVTGNSIIDFGGTSSLNITNLTISSGVTLTIQNWADLSDYFFTQNWTGAAYEIRGDSPMNQITFSGFDANDTKWQEYDNQVTPVPEPATYGVLLLAVLTVFPLVRRKLGKGR